MSAIQTKNTLEYNDNEETTVILSIFWKVIGKNKEVQTYVQLIYYFFVNFFHFCENCFSQSS